MERFAKLPIALEDPVQPHLQLLHLLLRQEVNALQRDQLALQMQVGAVVVFVSEKDETWSVDKISVYLSVGYRVLIYWEIYEMSCLWSYRIALL